MGFEPNKIFLAGEGFDPPTSGLWVRHASSAPPRYDTLTKVCVYKPHNYLI